MIHRRRLTYHLPAVWGWATTLTLLLLLLTPLTCRGQEPPSSPASAPNGAPSATPATNSDLFRRDNLIAWCIVPFDGKKRGPEERAAMLQRLGFQHFAYDYRAEHVPTFDAEIT